MEESSPSNYLIGGTGKKDAMLDDEDWEKDYIEDVEKAAENLQKVLNDAEAQRIKWKAPVVKVLMDLWFQEFALPHLSDSFFYFIRYSFLAAGLDGGFSLLGYDRL